MRHTAYTHTLLDQLVGCELDLPITPAQLVGLLVGCFHKFYLIKSAINQQAYGMMIVTRRLRDQKTIAHMLAGYSMNHLWQGIEPRCVHPESNALRPHL